MDISKNHADYNLMNPYWKFLRVFNGGLNDVQDYLPNVTRDISPDGVERNRQYKDFAVYTNFTARTLNALVGSVYRKPAQVEIPNGLDYLIDNASGSGMTLELISKRVINDLVLIGRIGLFVSAPNGNAKITTYSAENIKNWSVNDNGSLDRVELITGDKSEKHLLIDGKGNYITELYYDGELIDTVEPKDFNGKSLKEIPFIFCGSTDNNPDVDKPPLLDIARLSKGHYKNSADYEDIMGFMTPTSWVTIPNKSWLEELLPDGVYKFGSGAVIPVPEGGSAGILQASENQMHSKAMEQKEAQLIALGARIISGNSGVETAEAVRIRYSSENSVLDNLVGNASQAIRQCIEWCGLYNGVKGDVIYMLNREYFDVSVNPQQISADILLLDRGIVAVKDIRDNLRKSGYISEGRTDEEIDDEAESNAGGL